MGEPWLIVVEGKHDVARVRALAPQTVIMATNGWPSQTRILALKKLARGRSVALLTDADPAGRKIRAVLREIFPQAVDIYVRRSFNGVEHTPWLYLARGLERAGVITLDAVQAAAWAKEDGLEWQSRPQRRGFT